MYRRRRIRPPQDSQPRERWKEVNHRLDEVDREFNQLQARLQTLNDDIPSDLHGEQSFIELLEAKAYAANNILRETQDQFQGAIAEQASWYGARLHELEENYQAQAFQLLDDNVHFLENRLAQEQLILDQQANHLHISLDSIQQKYQDQHAYAEETIQYAQDCLQNLQERYPGEQMLTREIPLFITGLQQASSNLEQQFPEAALVTAQQTLQKLSILEMNLVEHIQKRQEANLHSWTHASQVIKEIRRHRYVQPADLSGAPLAVLIDVNFWSNNRLDQLSAKAQALLRQVEDAVKPLETEELEIIETSLSEIEQELHGVVAEACTMVLSSQVRFNIAQLVYAALQSQGYRLRKSWYEANDMRNPYRLSLDHLDGFQVKVRLSPLFDHPLTHLLELKTHGQANQTEHELTHRHGEIDRALKDHGLSIGQVSLPQPPAKPAERQFLLAEPFEVGLVSHAH